MFQLFILCCFLGLIAAILSIIVEYPLLILIPSLFAAIKLTLAILLHRRDQKKVAHLPSLPCEGHKGTWSNPEFFTEEELNSKE